MTDRYVLKAHERFVIGRETNDADLFVGY